MDFDAVDWGFPEWATPQLSDAEMRQHMAEWVRQDDFHPNAQGQLDDAAGFCEPSFPDEQE